MIYVRDGKGSVDQLNFNWTNNEPRILYVGVVKPPLTVAVPAWLAVDVVGCDKAQCDGGVCTLPRSARLSIVPSVNDNGEQREAIITMADNCSKPNVKEILVRQGRNPAKAEAEEAFDGLDKFRTCPQELEAMTEERDFFRSLVEEQFTAKKQG